VNRRKLGKIRSSADDVKQLHVYGVRKEYASDMGSAATTCCPASGVVESRIGAASRMAKSLSQQQIRARVLLSLDMSSRSRNNTGAN
jgi:hypothetical protein